MFSLIIAVGEEKTIFPLTFLVLGWGPHNKRQINKGKTKRCLLITTYTSCIHGDMQRKMSNSQKWLRTLA